jgi:hypothetical protein
VVRKGLDKSVPHVGLLVGLLFRDELRMRPQLSIALCNSKASVPKETSIFPSEVVFPIGTDVGEVIG